MMKDDTQILSGFQELAPVTEPMPTPSQVALVFDACQIGVVLRSVLFVELMVCVATMFNAGSLLQWLTYAALATGGALPATLAWLIATCGAKRWLGAWKPVVQYGAVMALGALAALYGVGLMHISGVLDKTPWLSSAMAGAVMAGLLVAGWVMRAKGRLPADTAARLTELQARIRPHFLFNTLNSAIALVRAEPAKAEAILEDLSDLFRNALVNHGDAVTLAHEVALAQRYLAIEQVRFGERLRVQWDIDSQAGAARLPPLLLQPLVENAVRHGVEPSGSGADILVSTQRRGSTVVVKVTNSVPAGQGVEGHGLALANVRERLVLLHDVQAQFRCGLKNGVYQVRMEIPV